MDTEPHPKETTRLNVTQAAKVAGIARSTLNRAIKNGRVSISRDGQGNPFIDKSELERVYGDLKEARANGVSDSQLKSVKIEAPTHREISVLKEMITELKAQRDEAVERHDKLFALHEATVRQLTHDRRTWWQKLLGVRRA